MLGIKRPQAGYRQVGSDQATALSYQHSAPHHMGEIAKIIKTQMKGINGESNNYK
jgi:hypothetical protein